MKNLLKPLLLLVFVFSSSAVTSWAQQVDLPRESPRAEVAQTIGDARVAIVYHRPSVKEREIFGKLVPFGQVWRTGANENTTFETSENVKINGQDLPAGKYGLHSIPNQNEWIIIFNRASGEWGSYNYKPSEDVLRVTVKPQTAPAAQETLKFDFETVTPKTATIVLAWDRTRVPFTIDAGDVTGRVFAKMKQALASAPPDNVQLRNAAVNFVVDNKIKDGYSDAMHWADESLKTRETFGALRAKARLAAEMGNYKEAVAVGDKAIVVAKAATPAINADFLAGFEKNLAEWKTKNK